jgi:hypothetical protein
MLLKLLVYLLLLEVFLHTSVGGGVGAFVVANAVVVVAIDGSFGVAVAVVVVVVVAPGEYSDDG